MGISKAYCTLTALQTPGLRDCLHSIKPQHLCDWHEGSLGQSQEVKPNCCYDINGMTNPFYLQLSRPDLTCHLTSKLSMRFEVLFCSCSGWPSYKDHSQSFHGPRVFVMSGPQGWNHRPSALSALSTYRPCQVH